MHPAKGSPGGTTDFGLGTLNLLWIFHHEMQPWWKPWLVGRYVGDSNHSRLRSQGVDHRGGLSNHCDTFGNPTSYGG